MRFKTFSVFKQFCRQSHFQRIGVVGIPFDKGQPKIGVAKAPACFRETGLIAELNSVYEGVDVCDYGDVSYQREENIETIPNMKQYEHIVSCTHEISKVVSKVIRDNRICLTIGGDHSISIGSIDGHVKSKSNNVSVLWIDAHADLNTNKTSPSGNIHGMPLALLVKELSDNWPYLPGMDWQKPVISMKNVAYIGLRSVDNYERLIIDKLAVNAFGIEDVEKFGVRAVLDMALHRIDPNNDRSLHVSFDIDSLDPLEAPSTGVPVRGGLTLREGIFIMEEIYKTGRLGVMDLVEVNPHIGSKEDVKKTTEAATCILKAAFGYKRKGIRPLNIDDIPLQTPANKHSL